MLLGTATFLSSSVRCESTKHRMRMIILNIHACIVLNFTLEQKVGYSKIWT